jgi:hypothetical protein
LNSRQKKALLHAARKLGVMIDRTKISPQPSTPQKPTPRQSKLQSQVRKASRVAWGAVVAVATIASLLGLYVLRPNIAIDPYASSNPAKPLTEEFSIQNSSMYTVRNVEPHCLADRIETRLLKMQGTTITNEAQFIDSLESGAKTSFRCPLGLDGNIVYKELAISVFVRFTIPLGINECRLTSFVATASEKNIVWKYHGTRPCPKKNAIQLVVSCPVPKCQMSGAQI